MAISGGGNYSFLDMSMAIVGPNISASIGGDGTGSAEEGFTVTFEEDIDMMTQGADGTVMHSMTAARRGTIELHLLKTSPTNALLSQMYSADKLNGSQQWAKNKITVTNPVSGDGYNCTNCGVRRFPANSYQMRGNVLTWVFNASQIDPVLGDLTIQ